MQLHRIYAPLPPSCISIEFYVKSQWKTRLITVRILKASNKLHPEKLNMPGRYLNIHAFPLRDRFKCRVFIKKFRMVHYISRITFFLLRLKEKFVFSKRRVFCVTEVTIGEDFFMKTEWSQCSSREEKVLEKVKVSKNFLFLRALKKRCVHPRSGYSRTMKFSIVFLSWPLQLVRSGKKSTGNQNFARACFFTLTYSVYKFPGEWKVFSWL